MYACMIRTCMLVYVHVCRVIWGTTILSFLLSFQKVTFRLLLKCLCYYPPYLHSPHQVDLFESRVLQAPPGRSVPCHLSQQDQLLHCLGVVYLCLFVDTPATAFWFCVGSSLYNPSHTCIYLFLPLPSCFFYYWYTHLFVCMCWVSHFLSFHWKGNGSNWRIKLPPLMAGMSTYGTTSLVPPF